MHDLSTACGTMFKGKGASASQHVDGSPFGVEDDYKAVLYLLNEVTFYTISLSFAWLLTQSGSGLLSSGA